MELLTRLVALGIRTHHDPDAPCIMCRVVELMGEDGTGDPVQMLSCGHRLCTAHAPVVFSRVCVVCFAIEAMTTSPLEKILGSLTDEDPAPFAQFLAKHNLRDDGDLE